MARDKHLVNQSAGNVAVLHGGLSAEREISLRSGQAVHAALVRLGVNCQLIDVQDNIIEQLQSQKFDKVFIALHGAGGEDGRMQALLEFFHLPYTGSGVQASALAMDKIKSKLIWLGLGLPTATFVNLNESTDWVTALKQMGGEAMVKPTHEGSSIGMSKVATPDELRQAFETARRYDSSVFAESLLTGSEYTVAILNNRALPVIKLETNHKFYDYDAKYNSDDTRYVCPCGLPSEQELKLQDLALTAFRSLDCKGWGRVDVMADSEGNFHLLEVNTVPGMTDHSLVPMAAKAAGLDFDELVGEILSQAV